MQVLTSLTELRPALPHFAPSPTPRLHSATPHYIYTMSVRRFLACRQSLHGSCQRIYVQPDYDRSRGKASREATYVSGELQSAWAVRKPRAGSEWSTVAVVGHIYGRDASASYRARVYVCESQAANTPALRRRPEIERRDETAESSWSAGAVQLGVYIPAKPDTACGARRSHGHPCRLHVPASRWPISPPASKPGRRTDRNASACPRPRPRPCPCPCPRRKEGTRRRCQSDPTAHVREVVGC
jgi:hypothetical protein